MKKDDIIYYLKKSVEYHDWAIKHSSPDKQMLIRIKNVKKALEEAIEIIEASKKSVNGCLFLSVVEALMDMVNQHCTYHGGLFDDGLSANELAFETLESLGFLKKKKGKHYLDWKHKYFEE